MEPLIIFENVVKRFNTHRVLDDISLEIKKGEVFGIIGRSGCGKSTLLKVLIGAYRVNSGRIIYDGKDVTNNPDKIKDFVGITTQENSFYDKLTVYENLKYYANLNNVRLGKARLHEILDSVGLLNNKNKIAGDMSGGMKRRLDFAISLVHNPKLLILDEPTTGLDPLLVKQFWKVVESVRREGKTIIVISHLFSELEDSCDRIGIMNKGRIERILPVKEKKSDLYKEFIEVVGNEGAGTQ
jgi:ABC-2 type transport system ATP-binding protein